jgi:hypothetical protein
VNKLLTNPFVLIFVGLLCIYLAIRGTTGNVLCHGVEMHAGDMCGDLSYDDKVRSNSIFTYGLIGIGAALILGSVVTIRKKRNNDNKK